MQMVEFYACCFWSHHAWINWSFSLPWTGNSWMPNGVSSYVAGVIWHAKGQTKCQGYCTKFENLNLRVPVRLSTVSSMGERINLLSSVSMSVDILEWKLLLITCLNVFDNEFSSAEFFPTWPWLFYCETLSICIFSDWKRTKILKIS